MADGYQGPVRDVSKDPRLNGKVLKSSKDSQGPERRKPSPAHSESSEEDEPLRNRQSQRKRMIHSFTPSPHQTPRLSPPKSPVAFTAKPSPQSPQSHKTHNSLRPASPNGAAPASKPSMPPIKIDLKSAQNLNLQTAPSKCYVPRSAPAKEPSTQSATAVKTSTMLPSGKEPTVASPPVEAPASESLPDTASRASSTTVPATPSSTLPGKAGGPPTVLQTESQAASNAGGNSFVPQTMPLDAAAKAAGSLPGPLIPAPESRSTSPAEVVTAPVAREQPTPVAVCQPSVPEPGAPTQALPTPVTPVVPTAMPAVTPTASHPPPPQAPKETPNPQLAEPGLLAPQNPPAPFKLFLCDGVQPGTHTIAKVGACSEAAILTRSSARQFRYLCTTRIT